MHERVPPMQNSPHVRHTVVRCSFPTPLADRSANTAREDHGSHRWDPFGVHWRTVRVGLLVDLGMQDLHVRIRVRVHIWTPQICGKLAERVCRLLKVVTKCCCFCYERVDRRVRAVLKLADAHHPVISSASAKTQEILYMCVKGGRTASTIIGPKWLRTHAMYIGR